MNCIFCKSISVVPIRQYESQVINKEFQLYSCVNCKSRFFNIDDDKDLPGLYDEQANRNSDLYQEYFQESRYWRREVEIINRLSALSTKGSILDIGCRTGDFLLHWPFEFQRVGVELSEVSASIARRRGLTVINASIENYDFPQKFNVITCYALIEHLKNPINFLHKLGPLMEKNGVLAILIPTWECLKLSIIETLGLRWHMYSPPLHVNFFSREKLDKTLADCGFELTNRRYTSGGLFNPLRRIKILNRVASRVIWEFEDHTPINRIPIFDHMYSYYIKL